MADILPFLSRLHIVSKIGEDLQFGDVMTWPQRVLIDHVNADLNNNTASRYIILKARQIGISTAVEGIMFTLAMSRPNFRGTVLAHQITSSQHLLGMTRYYYETFWARDAYPKRYAAQNQLAWGGTNSHLRISTANSVESGRGLTPHFLHGSEVAFWKDAETIMTGLHQSIGRDPGTFIFLESTANGVGGYFHDTWQRAMANDIRYTPLFFPWWAHPSYTATAIGLGDLARAFVFADDEERFLWNFLSKPRLVNGTHMPALSREEIASRLVWRREILATECQGDLNKFHQEYPSTPEEAFIATGSNVFALDRLAKIYEPMPNARVGRLYNENGKIRFIEDAGGPLEIYVPPGNGHYVIGGDAQKAVAASAMTSGTDYCCAQVIDRRTWEQAARLRGRWDQNSFGEQMLMLGYYYNEAILAPETGIGGPGVAAHLAARGYPRIWRHRKGNKMPGVVDNVLGWISSAQTKPQAIGNLQSAIFDATDPRALALDVGIRIHDEITFNEMRNYVVLIDGSFGNAGGKTSHDDTVMALGIALTVTKFEAANLVPLTREVDDDRFADHLGQTIALSAKVSDDRILMTGAAIPPRAPRSGDDYFAQELD